MDPHSRLSQFNQRRIKSGPPPISRFVSEMMPTHTLESFSQKPSTSILKTNKKLGSGLPAPTSALLVRRPIATNSRIKQNESYRKDMYLAFVNNALEQKINGNSQPFDELVDQFNPQHRTDPSSADLSTSLRTWILALTYVVSRLERAHSNLVEAIVNMPWTTLDSATVKSYTIFIGMLLSARPEYLSLVLEKIAQGFTYQSGLQTLSQTFPESSASPITRRVIYDRVHYLLQHLLSLIPTLPSALHPFLTQNFPHKRQIQLTQTVYIRNLLRVSSYCPELSEKILATIVHRIIQIDVEIQVELEEFEQENILEEQPLFDIDPIDVVVDQEEPESDLSDTDNLDDDGTGDDFSDLSSEVGGGLDDELPPDIPTDVKHIQDMVKKLDSMLTLVFDHFRRLHAIKPTPPNPMDDKPQGWSDPSFTPSPPVPPLSPLPPLPSDSSTPSPVTTRAFPDHYLPEASRDMSTFDPPSVSSATTRPPQTISNIMRIQFNVLLSIFDRTILRTFKSRYTQFLIFWFASLDQEFSDVFQGMLVERALLGSSPAYIRSLSEPFNQDDSSEMGASNLGGNVITRAAAASYIGSFVSRAVFVDAEGAKRVVAVLCEFLNAHLDEVEDSIRSCATPVEVGGHQHTVFYAVTQALFLIFCFRWRDLITSMDEEPQGETRSSGTGGSGGKVQQWIPELGMLKRVVGSVLNPLRVCSLNVVMQFARVAQATDFIYCYTILESNKRLENTSATTPASTNSHTVQASNHSSTPPPSTTISTSSRFGSGSVTAELTTFFPFDPYRLPRSSVFIRDVYRDWSSVTIDESDDEESDDEEDDETEHTYGLSKFSSEERHLTIPRRNRLESKAGNRDEATEGLSASIEQMSISPRPRGVITDPSVNRLPPQINNLNQ